MSMVLKWLVMIGYNSYQTCYKSLFSCWNLVGCVHTCQFCFSSKSACSKKHAALSFTDVLFACLCFGFCQFFFFLQECVHFVVNIFVCMCLSRVAEMIGMHQPKKQGHLWKRVFIPCSLNKEFKHSTGGKRKALP